MFRDDKTGTWMLAKLGFAFSHITYAVPITPTVLATGDTSEVHSLGDGRTTDMKLDRDINKNGEGKYGLILLRALRELPRDLQDKAAEALGTLVRLRVFDAGNKHSPSEFFLIRLKDQFASKALHAYADAAGEEGMFEWMDSVRELANRAANHPNQKLPD